jgi:hypothetical protein
MEEKIFINDLESTIFVFIVLDIVLFFLMPTIVTSYIWS